MTAFLAVLGAFALVTVAPGPANLAVALAAMSRGPGPAFRMACGLALGLACWGLLAAAGLGAVLASSEAALTGLRLAGGAFLFWLAAKSLRAAARPGGAAVPVGTARPFRTGLMLNLANPKAVFAWGAALAVGLDPASGPGFVAAATGACAMLGLANYLCWALLMSRARMRAIHSRLRRRIDALVSALFGLAGAALIREGLAR